MNYVFQNKFRSLHTLIHQTPVCPHLPFLCLCPYLCLSLSMPAPRPLPMPMPLLVPMPVHMPHAHAYAHEPCPMPVSMPMAIKFQMIVFTYHIVTYHLSLFGFSLSHISYPWLLITNHSAGAHAYHPVYAYANASAYAHALFPCHCQCLRLCSQAHQWILKIVWRRHLFCKFVSISYCPIWNTTYYLWFVLYFYYVVFNN